MPSLACRWMRAGPWETVLKTPSVIWVGLKFPPSVTSQSGYNRCSASLSAPERSQGAPQPLLAPLWLELAVFAVEIIDLGFHLRHLILQTSHVVVVLLQLEQHITQPILKVIAIGLLLQGLLDLL